MTEKPKRTVMAKRCLNTKKVLCVIFFNSEGPEKFKLIFQKVKQSPEMYKTMMCWGKLRYIRKGRDQSLEFATIWLLHDNAPAEKIQDCEIIFGKRKGHILPHPFYSPDLYPCDFPPKLQKHLSGTRYADMLQRMV